jgi:2-amino-4-hydroxy-6-hydroxymethyldihydropteridine diphosphokinase
MIWQHCYIGLGSNLGRSEESLTAAIEALSANDAIRNMLVSSYYQSKPHGPQDQPDYINAVAGFETLLEPEVLLDLLQALENEHGRVRNGERWSARTLDLDILLYADLEIDSDRLLVPHRWMRHREFVLYPLFEIAPALIFPDGTSLRECLGAVSDESLIRLAK